MFATTENTGSRAKAWAVFFCVVAAVAVLAAVLFEFAPAQYPFYPLCVFHRLTGLNCPGCGALRGLHELLHGNYATALRDNPLVMLSLPVVAFYLARYFSRWLAGQPVRLPEVRPLGIMIFVGVLILFTILRNLPFAPFVYLSPA